MFEELLVKPNQKVQLSLIEPNYDGIMSDKELRKKTKKNIKKIISLQERVYAEKKHSLLIIFQGIDTAGKDGVINKVFSPLNQQGCSVSSFKAPVGPELYHDFLWRIHKEVPEKGYIKIFNRSHYEEVLVVKVHNLIDDHECAKRFEHIKNFERLLNDCGTKIVKFFLYISKDEQKNRFLERIKNKEKNWKFSIKDLDERKMWDIYISQYELVLENTSTEYAPWYIVPSNNKKYRDYIVSSIVKKILKDMDPQYPLIEQDFENIIIE